MVAIYVGYEWPSHFFGGTSWVFVIGLLLIAVILRGFY
jgi:hypothetical protein